jgi:hypothetical protein
VVALADEDEQQQDEPVAEEEEKSISHEMSLAEFCRGRQVCFLRLRLLGLSGMIREFP